MSEGVSTCQKSYSLEFSKVLWLLYAITWGQMISSVWFNAYSFHEKWALGNWQWKMCVSLALKITFHLICNIFWSLLVFGSNLRCCKITWKSMVFSSSKNCSTYLVCETTEKSTKRKPKMLISKYAKARQQQYLQRMPLFLFESSHKYLDELMWTFQFERKVPRFFFCCVEAFPKIHFLNPICLMWFETRICTFQ